MINKSFGHSPARFVAYAVTYYLCAATDHELVGGLSDDNAVRCGPGGLTRIEGAVTSNANAGKLKRLLQLFIPAKTLDR
jgi:hypothetical protein